MSGGAVISQPGKDQKGEMVAMQQPGQPGAGFAQMPPSTQVVVPAGLPAGLAYLAGLEEIRIHQQLELMEGRSECQGFRGCVEGLTHAYCPAAAASMCQCLRLCRLSSRLL